MVREEYYTIEADTAEAAIVKFKRNPTEAEFIESGDVVRVLFEPVVVDVHESDDE